MTDKPYVLSPVLQMDLSACARAADALCRTVLCQYAGCVCAARVRSADPGRHCGGADVGKKAPVALLGTVHEARRRFSLHLCLQDV